MRCNLCRLSPGAREPVPNGGRRCHRVTRLGHQERQNQTQHRYHPNCRRWIIEARLPILASCIVSHHPCSGGNLAAILTLKAAEASPPIPLVFQLLIVPVTDNTATVENLWAENALTPWLSPARMLWFRDNYLPNKEDYTKWDASPYFAPDALLAKAPKAWIAVCECDILRDEGIAYGKKLSAVGVEVEVEVYKGAPHPIMAMDGTWLKL